MSNPTHAQLEIEEIERIMGTTDVNSTNTLQEYIKIRLIAKGLNPSEHIGKNLLYLMSPKYFSM